MSYKHYQETWSSSPFPNTVYSPPRDLVVQSVVQYRTYPTKRRCHLVRTRIPNIHNQETSSSSPCPNTVHTQPRDVVVYSLPQHCSHTTKIRGRLAVPQYRTYTTKRRGRLVRDPVPYICYQEAWSSTPYPKAVHILPRDEFV